MVEAVMIWNEPNNKSHWDFEIDPDWRVFAKMVNAATDSIKKVNPKPALCARRYLSDRSELHTNPGAAGCPQSRRCHRGSWIPVGLESLDNSRMAGQAGGNSSGNEACRLWVSEVGVSTFGAEEVQEFGVQKTAELLTGQLDRIHWYSLYDLPRAWPATTRHREAEGSSYYRHFYMGLLREDGSPKLAYKQFSKVHARRLGSASGFISRITVWTMLCSICRNSVCNIFVPASVGPTITARTRSIGSIGK